MGVGSIEVRGKHGSQKSYLGKLVYAMRIDTIMSMKDYDAYCHHNKEMSKKIPLNFDTAEDWKRIVGDCIYDYSRSNESKPRLRKVIHDEKSKDIDLGGKNTLLSKNFYYFGINAVEIPSAFDFLYKTKNTKNNLTQGHQIIEDEKLINELISWLSGNYVLNELYGEPQLKWKIENGELGKCKIECDN